MADEDSKILSNALAKRKEKGAFSSVTSGSGADVFEKGMKALRLIRQEIYPDEEWNKMSLKQRYAFLDEVQSILENPDKNRENPLYGYIRYALSKGKSDTERIYEMEEDVVLALNVLKRRRGSEKQIARMGKDRLGQRRSSRGKVEYYYSELKRKYPKASDEKVRQAAEKMDQAAREKEEADAYSEEMERADAYDRASKNSGKKDNSDNANAEDWGDWYNTADPNEPTDDGDGGGGDGGGSGGGAGGDRKSSENICPPEIEPIARMMVRRMPESKFDALWPVFKNYTPIKHAIETKRYGDGTEDRIRKCLLAIHRENFEDKNKGFQIGINRGQALRTDTSRNAFRNTLSAKIEHRGLFDSDNKSNESRYQMMGDPLTRSAINRGRRILRRDARAYYSKFMSKPPDRLKRAEESLEAAAKEYKENVKKFHDWLDRVIKKEDNKVNASSMLDLAKGDPTAVIGKILGGLSANKENGMLAVQASDFSTEVERSFKKWENAKKEFEEAQKVITMEELTKNMQTELKSKVEGISTALNSEYWKWSQSGKLNSDVIEKALNAEADYLSQYYAKLAFSKLRRYLPRAGLALRSAGMATQTFGESWTQMLHNVWNLFFGPWTTGVIFTLIQFFFVLTFIGYNLQLLWIFPLIGAAIVFLLNFADTKQPLDFVTHIASGAMIGYSAELLLLSLGGDQWSFTGGTTSFGFVLIWAILGFLGVFQFYQTGGYKVILQGSIIVLLLAYVAMGPYSGYYHQAIGQVKAPVEIAYRAVSSAVTDVYLLATNPTEWYARQQVLNARPEKPLDFPKGVEAVQFDSQPPSVSGGTQFFMTGVLKNDGVMAAKDVLIGYECNQWCKTGGASVPNTVTPSDSALARLERYMLSDSVKTGKLFYMKETMERGESILFNINDLVSTVFPKRAAETNFAKVTANIYYVYSTNSTLQLKIIGNDELTKQFQQGQTVFKSVTAISKGTPAQLSLNVGPQPLKAGSDASLLVSVYNTRENSNIMLFRGSEIIIRMPVSVGYNLSCNGQNEQLSGDDGDPNFETVRYKINPVSATDNYIEIKSSEFSSVYAFICKFKVNSDVNTTRTGLITGELPEYIFKVQQTRDVPITPPLGILYNPWEQECNKCGDQGVCTSDKCYANSATVTDPADKTKTCFYNGQATSDGQSAAQAAGQIATSVVSRVGSVCSACGPNPSCDRFANQQSCEIDSAPRCGISCFWNTTATNQLGVEVQRCDPKPGVAAPPVTGLAAGACALTDTTSVPETVIVNYVESNTPPDSIFRGHGSEIYRAAVSNNVNPAFMLALAMHEGDRGSSRISKCKLNPFGWGATDTCTDQCSDSSGCATRFSSVGEAISTVSKRVYERWLSSSPELPPQRVNLDQMSGNTPINNGWQVYATDPNWPNAMANWMSKITGQTCSATEIPTASATQAPATPGTTPTTTTSLKGTADYCAKKIAGQIPGVDAGRCTYGEGQCNGNNECETSAVEGPAGNQPQQPRPMICNTVFRACCYATDTGDACNTAFSAWKSK